MHPGGIQEIYLDWYQTLSTSVFWEPMVETSADLYGLLSHALFVSLQDHLGPWMRGAVTSEQIMRRVAQIAQVDYATVYGEFVRSCQAMKFIAPEVPQLVAELRRRGVRVVIATDHMDSFTRFTVPALGLSQIFDAVLNSSDLKALKDDFDAGGRSVFFHDYLLNRGLAPEQCVLIDDSELTRLSAERVGLGYRLVTNEVTLLDHLHQLLRNTFSCR